MRCAMGLLPAALCFSVSASIIPFHQTSRIRVRLSEGASVARIHGMDLKFYQKARAAGAPIIALTASRESDWELHCQDGRVRAQKINSDAEGQIGEQTLELQEPVTIRSASGFISYGGKPYREELQIHSAGSLCEVVNTVDLEKYLEGLVNAEFNSRWNEEAIGAQVVAARTYALYQIRQASAEDMHYDVDASTSDQVYDGSIREDRELRRSLPRAPMRFIKSAKRAPRTCTMMSMPRRRIKFTTDPFAKTRELRGSWVGLVDSF